MTSPHTLQDGESWGIQPWRMGCLAVQAERDTENIGKILQDRFGASAMSTHMGSGEAQHWYPSQTPARLHRWWRPSSEGLVIGSEGHAKGLADADIAHIQQNLPHIEAIAPSDVHALLHTQGGTISRDRIGLSVALNRLRIDVRHNIRASATEWRGGQAVPWERMTDRAAAALRAEIREGFEFRTHRGQTPAHFGMDAWREHLNALLHQREVDPFLLWLRALPPWDGVPRLESMAADALDAEPGVLSRHLGDALLTAAVRRTFRPGAKCDVMPVIIGPQGCGKSTFCRLLLPESHGEWFGDGLRLDESNARRVEALLGKVIVEASEFVGASKAQLESWKAFLSCSDDNAVRLAYRALPESRPRRCVLIGTANDGGSGVLPNDPTGNRRFIAISVGTGCTPDRVRNYTAKHRKLLWAEALARHLRDVPIHLPPHAIPAQASANETHRHRDIGIEDALQALIAKEGNQPRTLTELAKGISLCDQDAPLSTQAQRRLVHALHQLGHTRKQRTINGHRAMYWACWEDIR